MFYGTFSILKLKSMCLDIFSGMLSTFRALFQTPILFLFLIYIYIHTHTHIHTHPLPFAIHHTIFMVWPCNHEQTTIRMDIAIDLQCMYTGKCSNIFTAGSQYIRVWTLDHCQHLDSETTVCFMNPCHAVCILGNIKVYLYFLSFPRMKWHR